MHSPTLVAERVTPTSLSHPSTEGIAPVSNMHLLKLSKGKFTRLSASEPPVITLSSHSNEDGSCDTRPTNSSAPVMSFFQGSSNFKVDNSNFNEVHGNLINIQFGDGPFKETRSEQIRDSIANHVVLPDIDGKLKQHSLTQSIVNLPCSQAAYDDYQTKKKSGPCFKGTREALLQEMANWLTETGQSLIYVLSGLAGIGKSTVAYTIAARADELGLLGGSFFFSRDEADRRTAQKFFTTLAFQLCMYEKIFADAIGAALLTERGSSAITKDPHEQLRALILEPLHNIVASRVNSTLIVVDALDECDAEDSQSVLRALYQLVRDLPSFKVILTMRPQPRLGYHLYKQNGHRIFHLQDIEAKVVDGDIRLYLKYSLSQAEVQARLGNHEEQWQASDTDVDSLVDAAGRLFIIASTSVRFILDVFVSDPAAQMEKLLTAFAKNCTPLNDLNQFYAIILRNAVGEEGVDAYLVERYKTVVGAIVLIQTPLSVATLSSLIDRRDREIAAVLRNLQSVILLGPGNIPRIYHKSFSDYITDPQRCKGDDLLIDPKVHHPQMAVRCFRIMDRHLKYNILGLGGPARFMDNGHGIAKQGITDTQLLDKIPLELQYACEYWSSHLELANVEDEVFIKELEKFANAHLLHWVETLSWIRKLGSAHHAIRAVMTLLNGHSAFLELYRLFSDGLHFVTKFYEIIERSALHTYYSALPFAPTECSLYHRYKNETIHNLYRVYGGPEKWDALLATRGHGERYVPHVAFSPDTTILASRNCTGLKLFDATMGIPLSEIMADHVAIAADFSVVVFSKDDITLLQDLKGSPVARLTSLHGYHKLAISSGGTRVAAGFLDGTVELWNVERGELVARLHGFQGRATDDAKNLAFSTSGTRLAYQLADGGIKLVDGTNGEFIADLDHQSHAHMFAFARYGSRIATLARGRGILTLWNTENGEVVGVTNLKLKSGGELAISANGSLLATGECQEVTIWASSSTSNTLQIVEVLTTPEGGGVYSLAFSSDGILAVAYAASFVVLWDVMKGAIISTLPCVNPRTLAFSSDCKRLAVGSITGILHLWDIRIIKEFISPLGRYAKAVTAVDLSRDCSQLACGYDCGTIELWATSRTPQLIASRQSYEEVSVETVVFSPDGKQLVSRSFFGYVKMWDGRNLDPIATSQDLSVRKCTAAALSNCLLATATNGHISLWDPQFIGTIKDCDSKFLSFSNNGSLLVSFHESWDTITIFDIVQLDAIVTLKPNRWVHRTTFCPDDFQLLVHFDNGDSQSFDVPSDEIRDYQGYNIMTFMRSSPQCKDLVPVLWIPKSLGVVSSVQRSSAAAFGCNDGRIVFVQSSSSAVSDGPLRYHNY